MYSVFAEVFASVWLFMTGASIGSFLNVVAYRLPRHLTLLGNSQCPICNSRIAAYDNLPVLGWLILRGRCRTCRFQISSRYPLVEALLGVVFWWVGIAVLALAAVNLPGVTPPRYWGFAWNFFDPQINLLTLYVVDVTLLSLLAAGLLFDIDHQTLPLPIVMLLLIAAIVAGVISPKLPGGVSGALGDFATTFTFRDLRWRFLGVFAGGAAGIAISLTCDKSPNPAARPAFARPAAIWGIVGFWLGVYALFSVFLLATMLAMIARTWRGTERHRLLALPTALLFWASFLHVFLWRLLTHLPGWPLNGERPFATGGWLGCALVSVWVLSRTRTVS